MEKPLVSVIINTYNHREYISQAIESVLMQRTTFAIEIIIGEDESNDGTKEICVEYANKHPEKIRLFLRTRKEVIYINKRPTGRHNFIENIKNARGEYVALLPGDDYWTDPFKLQKQIDYLESNPDCVLCHHWQEVDELGSEGNFCRKQAPIVGHGYYPVEKATVQQVFSNELRVKSRTLMFRNVNLEFPDWYFKVAFGDVPLIMLLGKYGKFGFIDEKMAVYRLTGNGVSTLGREHKLYLFNHYKSWIKIWEYGLMQYDYKFSEEGSKTIVYFYKTILKKYSNSLVVFGRLVFNCFILSELPLKYRLIIFRNVFPAYIKNKASELKKTLF